MRKTALLVALLLFGVSDNTLLPLGADESKTFTYREDSPVGQVGLNRYLTPTGQMLTPAGLQIPLRGMRPEALALSPDGLLLAAAGKKDALILIDAVTGQVLQTVPLSFIETKPKPPSKSAETNHLDVTNSVPISNSAPATISVTNSAEMSLNGLNFSPAGDRLY